ncbi:sulfotransferase [Sphingomonas qomolangmaensis]|uniref:Sulfotransferase n=1 Tax=Sphingomonas qomolangmaensis TaxID=2918765 RepID=A0ABY5L5Y6_9SPHN|nr:sulfotransferase [Sphingomonas qomolangmaensis]UUL82360.1 sulfotransferase [Sphingomonas qomolangmaensis]
MPTVFQSPRYVFVGGLHRSGTSMVAALVAKAPGVGAIGGAPVPEQEGVYLQGGIPHTARHGIPGAFAFDPDQHLTEASAYNSAEVEGRLSASWDRWYPAEATLRVEKSPVNLLRSRLYQQLFPTASFVFVVRHPVVVARATSKWSEAPVARLVEHWDAAHRLLLDDLPYLHNYLIVRYEDLVADPARALARIGGFIDRPIGDASGIEDRNSGYAGGDRIAVPDVARRLGYRNDIATLEAPEIAMHRHCLSEIRSRIDRLD